MQQVINRAASPSLGMAAGYFLVILYLVPEGHLAQGHAEEAVAMAGVVCTHIIIEIQGFFRWIGSLFSKGDK